MTDEEEHDATRSLDARVLDDEMTGGPNVATVIFHGRLGAEVVRIPFGASVVVGREAPADIVVDDPSLSRRHARLVANEAGLAVEDLGSKNGTRLDGERVQSGQLIPGSTLALGAVVVALADRAGAEARFDEYERFTARLEQEAARAHDTGSDLSLIVVRSEGGGGGWRARMRSELRATDPMARFGVDSVVVLLPELGSDRALETAHALTSPRRGEPRLFSGVASLSSADSPGALLEAARRACGAACTERPTVAARTRVEPHAPVVVSAEMREVYRLAERAAKHPVSVLVLGETGTGKELVARAVHDASARRGAPFKAVNCAAIPATLAESVLFGHERGAFTGADARRSGLFEEAQAGTVFLDEIAELALSAQASLLRALETKRVCRVGSTHEIEVDVRVIAATHADLDAMIAAKTFRADLYHRLNLLTIRIPPLRERAEDIPALAEHFLQLARREFRAAVATITPEALAALARYHWPGNVRELRNVVERAAVVGAGTAVELSDLPEPVRLGSVKQTRPPDAAHADGAPFGVRVREYEVELIERALAQSGDNQTLAAKILDMPLRTLVFKIRAYNIATRRR